MTSAVGVMADTAPVHGAGAGSIPSTALHQIRVVPISFTAAKRILERNHYLHSMPGGTKLPFGVMLDSRLLGAMTFGAGPFNAYALVESANPSDCVTLSRFWLSDELPPNAESRCLGVALRAIRKHTSIKFVVSYADPSQGHMGTIYQATGWVYTGLSEVMPLVDLGDGKPKHSRSLSHSYSTHSMKYFKAHGVGVRLVPQAAKHRYVYFLDKAWKNKLRTPILPYPRKGDQL